MKILVKIFLGISIISSQICKAQSNPNKDYKQFEDSFFSNFKYPFPPEGTCKQIICLITIKTDKAGTVNAINISDSADSLTHNIFLQIKPKLDIKSLQKYLNIEFKNKKNQTYLIPFSYTFINMPCQSKQITIEQFKDYYIFDGKQLYGTITMLSAMGRTVKIER